ncbi:MAG TPA: plasmid encoded RepA protein [Parvularcula sp.]|nr:plasmid encoded RepA protein [Parvularcula sp.]
MFWVTTEAVRTKDRRLYLGESVAEFMRELNLDPGRGGPRSDYRRLQNQMERFFRATISFEYLEGDALAGEEGWADIQIGAKSQIWWDLKNPEQGAIFESWVELNYDFFQSITKSPVPVDMRALRALKNSALALDLYVWATYKTYLANEKGASKPVTWRQLHKQFGADYARLNNFTRKAREALDLVRVVYPGLNIDFVHGGLWIKPGDLSVTSVPRLVR